MSNTMQVPIADIILDPRLQMRETMDFACIDDYAENLMDLPPGKIVMGEGGLMWLTGGWHRYHAHKKANQNTMACIVREGTFQDALKEAAGENHGHGLKRTDADKRRAVKALLSEPLWLERSDRMVSEACHVSNHLVSVVRKELTENSSQDEDTKEEPTKKRKSTGKNPSSKKRTGKDGKKRHAAKEKPRCERCKRFWPYIDKSVDDCSACLYLRTGKTGSEKDDEDDEEPEEEEAKEEPIVIVDDAGVTVPESLVAVFQARGDFKKAAASLTNCSNAFKVIEKGPTKDKKSITDKHYRKFFGTFKAGRERLVAMEPVLVCTPCEGQGCNRCQNDGWLSREEADAQGAKPK